MWYIAEAEKGAGIYLGFNRDVTQTEFEKAIQDNTLTSLLNFYEVKAGDCYFIPSGTIHAIGAGCLICEIQQNSNLTYRVYDYNRKDKNGNTRELHIDKALSVTNLQAFTPVTFEKGVLGASEYFFVKKYEINGGMRLQTDEKSFQCVICVKGNGEINGENMHVGDAFFVPACYGEYELFGDMEIIVASV